VAFVVFLRQFSQVRFNHLFAHFRLKNYNKILQAWGVSVGGTILQNALIRKLPENAILGQEKALTTGQQLAYAIVPLISTLSQPLQDEVRQAFLESFREVWIAFAVCAAIGLFSWFAMKNYPLKKSVDQEWGIDRSRKHPEPEIEVVQGTEKQVNS
jgi:hypothetical protein